MNWNWNWNWNWNANGYDEHDGILGLAAEQTLLCNDNKHRRRAAFYWQ
jgi:hypothetical protein